MKHNGEFKHMIKMYIQSTKRLFPGLSFNKLEGPFFNQYYSIIQSLNRSSTNIINYAYWTWNKNIVLFITFPIKYSTSVIIHYHLGYFPHVTLVALPFR